MYFCTGMKKKEIQVATVFDVARQAGVSRGTVDRVLHSRGRVSPDTVEKVRAAIEQLGFQPNQEASTLALKGFCRLSCLIPSSRPGSYWDEIEKGFLQTDRILRKARVDLVRFDQTDPDSFRSAAVSVLETAPDGVILCAVFPDLARVFCEDLSRAGIPFAFVDNKVDDVPYTLYYGVDPAKNGALGAYLLTLHRKVEDIVLVRLIRDSRHLADPNGPRREAFLSYIRDRFPDCRIHTVFIKPDDPGQIMAALDAFFAGHPEVKSVAMTNSRVFLIGPWLLAHPDPERVVVGFDDLESNLHFLRQGAISLLVTRHISRQSSGLLAEFADGIIRHRLPLRQNHYVHMDILTARNLDDY